MRAAAVLVRLRADRCFYAEPPPRAYSPLGGRPRRHGRKMACADPATWPEPTTALVVEDPDYGRVDVRAWAGLTPSSAPSRRPAPGTTARSCAVPCSGWPSPACPGARRSPPTPTWDGCGGPARAPPTSTSVGGPTCTASTSSALREADARLDDASGAPPRGRRPLDVAGGGRLHLVAPGPPGRRGPPPAGERPRPAGRLTPGRVRRGFPHLLVALGSPAGAPKPAGRPPGRPRGRRSGPAPGHPAVKKAA